MRDLMNGEEEVLVCSGSNHICRCEKFPGEHGGVAKQVRAADLKGDDAQNDIFSQGLWSAELGHLKENTEAVSSCLVEKATTRWETMRAPPDGL